MAEMLRVAVTGGSGQIGRCLVRLLLDRGHKVVNVDRRRGDDDRARFAFCDVRHREPLTQILADCDAVCHLADIAFADVRMNQDEVYWSNARSGSVVLQTAADARMRQAVYCSTAQVYGCWSHYREAPVRLPIDETYLLRPQNAYAVSKAANEAFARCVSKQEKLPIAIFRFPWVVSREFSDEQLDWFEKDDGPVDDGFATFVHVSDVARAMVAALETNRPGCEVYNLSAPDVISGVPLRKRLLKHHPQFPQLPENWPAHKSPLLTEKARAELGWEAKWSFREYFKAKKGRELREVEGLGVAKG